VAERLIQGASPSLGVARVLAWSARQRMLAGEREHGLAQAREALALAEQLQLDEVRIHALTTIGSAKEFLSDTSGREDLRRAIDIARSTNSPLLAGALNNLSVALDTYSVRETDVLAREALEQAVRFGDREIARFMRSNLVIGAWLMCEWEEAMDLADEFIAECEAGSPHILEGPTRLARACIQLARGRRDAATPEFDRALELARETRNDLQHPLVPALIRGAWAQICIGDVQRARALFGEAVPLLQRDPYSRPWMLPEVALDLGATATVREVMSQLPPTPVRSAGLAVLDADFRSAADLYEQAGVVLFEAEARLRLAEQLIGEGRGGEGQAELEKALAVYRPIGAVLFIERGERLLAREAAG
jgi:tetratricopeptide (TPR) repeat protein